MDRRHLDALGFLDVAEALPAVHGDLQPLEPRDGQPQLDGSPQVELLPEPPEVGEHRVCNAGDVLRHHLVDQPAGDPRRPVAMDPHESDGRRAGGALRPAPGSSDRRRKATRRIDEGG
jgi:hypothetical protein